MSHVYTFFCVCPRGVGVSVEFGAVVCGYAVEDEESYAVALYHDGDLETENVVLGFEVGGYDAVDSV